MAIATPSMAETAPATTPTATTVPHVKFSLTAKGLLHYEVTLTYASVDDLMQHAVTDALRFDIAARAVFPNLVPAAKAGQSGTAAD